MQAHFTDADQALELVISEASTEEALLCREFLRQAEGGRLALGNRGVLSFRAAGVLAELTEDEACELAAELGGAAGVTMRRVARQFLQSQEALKRCGEGSMPPVGNAPEKLVGPPRSVSGRERRGR